MKHTEKPWKAGYTFNGPRKSLDIYGADGHCIATMRIGNGQAQAECDANIITEAPNLLEALILLEAIYGEDDTEAIDQARDAIARAKGEEDK